MLKRADTKDFKSLFPSREPSNLTVTTNHTDFSERGYFTPGSELSPLVGSKSSITRERK